MVDDEFVMDMDSSKLSGVSNVFANISRTKKTNLSPVKEPWGKIPPLAKGQFHYLASIWLRAGAEPQHGIGGNVLEFRFASYFQNYMVLQRGGKGALIWGFGEPKAVVSLTFHLEWIARRTSDLQGHENSTMPKGRGHEVIVSDDGIWQIRLPPTEAGGPYEIRAWSTVSGTNLDIKINSVLFGDVWLCSGQSNMEFRVEWMMGGLEELKNASSFSNVRFMEVMQASSYAPILEPIIRSGWAQPNEATLKEFSGACWYFGRRLQKTLRIPVGLIGSYYGGSALKTWVDREGISNCLKQIAKHRPRIYDDAVLWNGMVKPLTQLDIKGVLWYQGEADSYEDHNSFLCLMPAMIDSWRKHFRQPSMPFGIVQLACPPEQKHPGWSSVRWHQTADIGVVPNDILRNVFMAVALDLCDPKSPYGSIHPRYKIEIGERLLLGALSLAYHIPTPFQGPSPAYSSRVDNKVIVTFRDGPIVLRGNSASAFEVCCGYSNASRSDSSWNDCSQWDAVKQAPRICVVELLVMVLKMLS
ncbi:Sialate O-acetylesterase [Hypsibius exemplaris]|uniref:Sialate O-acetylesterase n=1 Tax=Hypsibius exemplaris TaxID=2072580 RepID=A0A9X6NAC5_HYPEX|nr:Sialate O-acetylesterase [Hypsibius exemplaris]